jgi:hypothetical protein
MDHIQKLKDLAVSESGFVFDPFTGATFNTNGTGRAILEGLKVGKDRGAMLESLRGAFEVGDEDLERDLDEFLYLLRENGILPTGFQLEDGDK